GLYTSGAGMDVQQARVESVSSNLANAATPGYKKEDVQVRSFPEMLLIQQGGPRRRGMPPLPVFPQRIGAMGTGALVAGTTVDYAPGTVQETGNSTDIMIKGPGFFAVNVPAEGDPERVCYTRNGAFKVDREGYLVTGEGYRVLGEAGAVQVGGEDFKVAPDGTVEAGGIQVDRLRLVEFDDPAALRKEAGGLFADPLGAARPAAATTVSQGFLEGSNVNVVDEMVDLVAVMRAYEANQRLVQAHDELLAKAANQVGSLR
ncbi:MAG: flagellar basal-body rod protein FlgF, partial [Peptococcaceae bacterium]|nr:flagellar basal-body rod protein FlgF [Peptococcaceae bacterium]